MATIPRCIDWTIGKLFEMYPNLDRLKDTTHPEKTPREILIARIVWGMQRKFTFFWGDKYGPTGALMLRPVNPEIIEASEEDYWGNIFAFDVSGDICGVDYAYGPGLYPEMITLCKASGKSWIAYRHKNVLRVTHMSKMPDRGVLRLSVHP